MEQPLRRLLDELADAIQRSRDSDSDPTELASLVKAVEARLAAETGDGEPDDDEGLAENLERAAIRFEVEHPRLAAAISRVVEVLSSAGI